MRRPTRTTPTESAMRATRRAVQAWMRLIVAVANSPVTLEDGNDFVV